MILLNLHLTCDWVVLFRRNFFTVVKFIDDSNLFCFDRRKWFLSPHRFGVVYYYLFGEVVNLNPESFALICGVLGNYVHTTWNGRIQSWLAWSTSWHVENLQRFIYVGLRSNKCYFYRQAFRLKAVINASSFSVFLHPWPTGPSTALGYVMNIFRLPEWYLKEGLL